MKRLHRQLFPLPHRAAYCLIFGVIANSLALNAAAIQFIPLGPAHVAWDVSGDGKTVVGDTSSSGFRWTVTNGFELLTELESADAVSSDGSVIAGTVRKAAPFTRAPAIWTQSSGVQLISELPNTESSAVRGISGDGRVVVGYMSPTSGPNRAFRWDTANGTESISVDLTGGIDSANAVSEDGDVIVGRDGPNAFRWTRQTGLVSLSRIGPNAAGWGVSADGAMVVGNSGQQAFLWMEAGVMQGMGDLSGGDFASAAWDITPDGSTIVGNGSTGRGLEAFIWTQSSGMRSLMDIVEQAGVNLTGWQLQVARGISDNGQVIVGAGTNPQGRSEAWVILIPEPSTFAITVAAVFLFSCVRRKSVPHNRV